MAIICPSCGSSNPDHVTYCGKCGGQLSVSQRAPASDRDVDRIARQILSMKVSEEPSDNIGDTMVAIAINVRRIFIVLLFYVLVVAINSLFSLILQAKGMDYESVKSLAIISSLAIAILAVLTIYVAVVRKRISCL